MLPVLAWEIWYGDGSVWTDRMGTWRRASSTNVQGVVLFHARPYATLMYGVDFYLLPGQAENTRKTGAWLSDVAWEPMRGQIDGRAADWRA